MQAGRAILGRRRSAPADLKKDAGGFDLSIALGLLLGSGQVAFDRSGPYAIVGELTLTGETQPISGLPTMQTVHKPDRSSGPRGQGTQRGHGSPIELQLAASGVNGLLKNVPGRVKSGPVGRAPDWRYRC